MPLNSFVSLKHLFEDPTTKTPSDCQPTDKEEDGGDQAGPIEIRYSSNGVTRRAASSITSSKTDQEATDRKPNCPPETGIICGQKLNSL